MNAITPTRFPARSLSTKTDDAELVGRRHCIAGKPVVRADYPDFGALLRREGVKGENAVVQRGLATLAAGS